MPMYEYQCGQCGRRTEKRQKFADAPLTECPFCGGPLKKLISAPAVQFKGGGWYADGYGSKKPAASGSGEASASTAQGESGASSSAKTEGSPSSGSEPSKASSSASSDSSAGSAASSSAASSTPGAPAK